MDTKKTVYRAFGLMLLIMLTTGMLSAAPGDCNGDGSITINDITVLVNYIYLNEGTPSNLADCDCDGHQGLTAGDMYNLISNLFFLEGILSTPWGSDWIRPDGFELFFNKRISFDAQHTVDTISVYVKVPDDLAVMALSIPFSFAAEDNQMEVSCTGCSLEGSVCSLLSPNIYNDDKAIVLIISPTYPPGTVLAPGSEGLLFKAFFTKVSDGAPNDLRMSAYNRSTPMVFSSLGYFGIDGERIYMPSVTSPISGDGNCDRIVNVSDAVVIINYIFLGGASPGDCDY